MSLSSSKAFEEDAVPALICRGQKRNRLFPWMCVALAAARWTWCFCTQSPSLVKERGKKLCGFCHRLCIDGYYKLLELGPEWSIHLLRKINILSTWSILDSLSDPYKSKPQNRTCMNKINDSTQWHSVVSWSELDVLEAMCGLRNI